MKAKSDAERMLSGRKELEPLRALALARTLEAEAPKGGHELALTRARLLNRLIVEWGERLFLRGDTDGVWIASREGAPASQLRAEDVEPAVAAQLASRHGIELDVPEPPVRGLSVSPLQRHERAPLREYAVERLVEMARQSIAAGEYADAERALRLAVFRSQGAAPVVWEWLDACVAAGVEGEGVSGFAREQELREGRSPSTLLRRIQLALRGGRANEVSDAVDSALLVDDHPLASELRLSAARALLSAGQPRRAVVALAGLGSAPEVVALRQQADEALRSELVALEAEVREALGLAHVEAARHALARLLEVAGGAEAGRYDALQRELWEAAVQTQLAAPAVATSSGPALSSRLAAVNQLLAEGARLGHAHRGLSAEAARLEELVAQAVAQQLGSALAAEDYLLASRLVWGWLAVSRRAPEPASTPTPERAVMGLFAAKANVVLAQPDSALAQWIAGEQLWRMGRIDEAAVALRDVPGGFGADPDLGALRGAVESALESRRREQAREALANVELLALEGEYAAALAALERATALGADVPGGAARRREELQVQARDAQRVAEVGLKAQQALASGKPFTALSALRQLTPAQQQAESIRAAFASATDAARQLYPVANLALDSSPSAGPELSSAQLGLDAIVPKDLRVGMMSATGDLMLATKDRLFVVSGSTLELLHAVSLPESLSAADGGDAIFACGSRGGRHRSFVFWGRGAGTLTTLDLPDGGPAEVTALHDIKALWPKPKNKNQVAQSMSFCSEREELWVLDTFQRSGGHEARLCIIDPIGGRLVAVESFPVGVTQLSPLQGTDCHVVSRMYEPPSKRGKGWFHAAVLDARGRATERWDFNDTDDEVYAIRRAIRSPSTQRTYAEHWFVDPRTGKVPSDAQGLVALREEGRLVYQGRAPAGLLAPGLRLTGAMGVHSEPDRRDLLLWPWVDENKQGGMAAVDGDSIRLLGHAALGPQEFVGALRNDPARGRSFCVIFSSAGPGFRVTRFDPTTIIAA
jgi:hypothetical protein